MDESTFAYPELPTTVSTKEVFTSSQLHLWITKTRAQRAELPDIATNKVTSAD